MKLRLRRISPISLASTLGWIYFIIGLFVAFFGFIMSFSSTQFTMNGPVTFSGSGLSMLPLALAYPFLSALIGFVSGLIIAWIYNYTVRFSKGLLLEFTEALLHEE